MSNNGKRVAMGDRRRQRYRGKAGAESLAAEGWTVVVSGRRKAALDAVVGQHYQRRRQG